MFARALFAFLALPGMVAFVIPVWIATEGSVVRTFHLTGALPIALGTVLLLWCVLDFYVAGKGTLAPWSPPRHLVVRGLYRWSRNPMYLAVTLILIGWTAGYRLRSLLTYTVAVIVVFYLRVVVFE